MDPLARLDLARVALALVLAVPLAGLASSTGAAQAARTVRVVSPSCRPLPWQERALASALRVELRGIDAELVGASSGAATVEVELRDACGGPPVGPRVELWIGGQRVGEVSFEDVAPSVRGRALAMAVADHAGRALEAAQAEALAAARRSASSTSPTSTESTSTESTSTESTSTESTSTESDAALPAELAASAGRRGEEVRLDGERAGRAGGLGAPVSTAGSSRPFALRATAEGNDVWEDSTLMGGGGLRLGWTLVPELPLAVFVRGRVLSGRSTDNGGSATGTLVEGAVGVEALVELDWLRLAASAGIGGGYLGLVGQPTGTGLGPAPMPFRNDFGVVSAEVGGTVSAALVPELALVLEGGVRPYLVGPTGFSVDAFTLRGWIPWAALGVEWRP